MKNKAIVLCENLNNDYSKIKSVLNDFGINLIEVESLKLIIKFLYENQNGIIFIEKKFCKYYYFIKCLVNDFEYFKNYCFVFFNDKTIDGKLNNSLKNVYVINSNNNVEQNVNKIIKISGIDLNLKNIFSENDIKQKINNMLIQLGFLPKYTGFKYIADGLNYVIINKVNNKNQCKVIYDYLIKEYNVNIGSIERNIKSATNNAMKSDGMIFELFSSLNKKATNRTILSFLVEYLLTTIGSDISILSEEEAN